MNKYELVIIVRPDLSEDDIEKVNTNMQNKIKEYANLKECNCLGKKTLAYEIKNNKEGYYFIYNFEVSDKEKSTAISETERYCRITDDIIKFLTVKQD